jgi:CBS domain-containing protein
MKVSDVMTRDVISVDKDEKLERIVSLMEKHRVSKIPVTEKGSLVGIVTDGDLMDELGAIRNKTTTANTLHVSAAMQRKAPTIDSEADVEDAIEAMKRDGHAGMLPVVHNGTLVGVVTKADFLPLVTSTRPVREFMVTQLHAVEPTERLVHARRLMLDHGVERLPVLQGGKLVGVLAETDLAIALARFKDAIPVNHQQAQLRRLFVEDVMTKNVVSGTPDMTARDAARVMRENDVGCLPIVNPASGKIAGMITRSDLIRLLET